MNQDQALRASEDRRETFGRHASRKARRGRFGGGFAALFLGSCAVLVLVGYWYHSDRRAEAYVAAHRELSEIADLKLRQIADWREERLSDAHFFSRAQFAARDLRRFLHSPDSEEARQAVTHWLKLLKGGERYSAVMVLDGQLQRRLAIPESASVFPDCARRLLEQARESRDVVMGELEQDGTNGLVHLEVLFPIFASAELKEGAPIGAVLLRLDPRHFLFPLLQSWPAPSRTAETLLVRREGNDVLYLSELRDRPGAATPLRLSFDSPRLPAAKFLRGERGPIEGIDYRGVPVVAEAHRVPGTSWLMVAKVDREEIYATLGRQTRGALLVLGALVLAGTLLGALLWRQRREEAEEKLRLHATALEAAANAIVITGADGRMEWVNGAFTRLTGYAAAEAIGQDPRVLRSGKHTPEFYREMWTTIKERRVWHGELINKRKDGTLYTEEMTITPVADNGGEITHYIAIKQDISGRKQAEAALRQAHDELESRVQARTAELQSSNEALERTLVEGERREREIRRLNHELNLRLGQLEAANKEMESFAHSVSHDLRAPLRSIDGFSAALLEDYADRLDDAGRDHLQSVRGASQRMGQLIDDLLGLSRVTRQQLRRANVNLTALAQSVAGGLASAEPGRQAEFVIPPGLTVNADPNLLRSVLENLFTNAWKFTARKAHARIELGQTERDGETVFFIRDNGAGFDMAYIDKLFGAFQRLHSAHDFPGTGIGLATVQRIIHRHGGRVWAEGKPGEGACFYFTLPRMLETPAT